MFRVAVLRVERLRTEVALERWRYCGAVDRLDRRCGAFARLAAPRRVSARQGQTRFQRFLGRRETALHSDLQSINQGNPSENGNSSTETDHPWAGSAVEAARGLLAAAHGQLQKLPMGSHLCTGSLWVKSVLSHGQLLITQGQPLILPVGSVPTTHW